MAESPTDELRMLRERAYGPDADIHEDPAALARLRELEDRTTASAVVEAVPGDAVVPPTLGPTEAEPPADPEPPADSPAGSDGAPTPEPSARARLRPRTAWLWGGSVVLAVILGAWVATAVSGAESGGVAVLAEAPMENWPTTFFGEPDEGAMVFDPFHGLTVLKIPNAMGTADADMSCLVVLHGALDDGTFGTSGGTVATGCGAGGFEAQATGTVSPTAPEELRAEYPVGTALQFVLEGSQVNVFADTSTADSPTEG